MPSEPSSERAERPTSKVLFKILSMCHFDHCITRASDAHAANRFAAAPCCACRSEGP